MDKQKLVIGATKVAIGLVTSVLIGATIKQEKKVVDLLTTNYGTTPTTTIEP